MAKKQPWLLFLTMPYSISHPKKPAKGTTIEIYIMAKRKTLRLPNSQAAASAQVKEIKIAVAVPASWALRGDVGGAGKGEYRLVITWSWRHKIGKV